jgi:hypothetical protein
MASGFSFYGEEIEKRLLSLLEVATPRACEMALGQAGQQLLRDAIMEEPMVPLEEGT